MSVNILWPENRHVSFEQIKTWYSDAVANEQVDGAATTDNIEAMAFELHDAGLITLHENWDLDR